METRVITRVNNVDILASNVSEQLIPIKPICEALGVDYPNQYKKLKEHPIYSSSIVLSTMIASDNKAREMTCIPIQFLSGWIFSINPANVKEEAKEEKRLEKLKMEARLMQLREENEKEF